MADRTCIHCGGAKPGSEFYVRKLAHGDGLTGECKVCRRVRARKHYADNTARHKELVGRRYREHFRFARYGLTAESFAAMLAAQDGKCAMCGTSEPGGKGEWHIDHEGGTDRSKGLYQCVASKVRGLLCHSCNVSLGHLEKLTARVGADVLARYLTRTTPVKSTSSPLKQPLYQVVVERTSDGAAIRVGPAMLKEATDQFAETIRQQIALGREKEWSSPHVVPFLNHNSH